MIRLLSFVTVLSLAFASTADAGRLSGERSLNKKKHGYQIVRGISRAGKKSQRFEVRPGDCGKGSGWSDCANDRERSEYKIKKAMRFGKDHWIGFSVYLPKDFYASPSVNTTVGQIHQRGGPSGTVRGLPSNPPLVQLEMRGNSYRAGVHILTGSANNVRDDVKYFDLARLSAMRGRWTDVMIHLDTSNGNEVFEVYINGARKGRIADFINFVPKEYYFKYGIYRSFISKEKRPMPTQILYIDEVKYGKSAGQVAINPNKPVD